MKKILLLCIVITSCAATRQTEKVNQGIIGEVYLKRGNQMPSPGMPPNNGMPVSTTIYVYQLTNREQATDNNNHYNNIQTRLIAKGKSNDSGAYIIALPPGRYSVFVEDAGKPWTNISDGEGNLNPIEVKKSSLTNVNLTLSANATY